MLQVVTPAAPDVLDRRRTAEGSESIVAGRGVLAHEKTQMRQRGDVRHRRIVCVEGQPREMVELSERRESFPSDSEAVVVDVESEEAVKDGEPGQSLVGERASQQEVVRTCI